MKRKDKAFVKEHVEKLVKKKTMSKVKESQKMLQWMKMDSNELKWFCSPKLFVRLNYKSKCEKNERIKSQGTFFGSQHFEGRGMLELQDGD